MKTLIVYYSKDGNTKKIVDLLQQKIDADTFDAVTDAVYDDDDWKASEQALSEINSGHLPELRNTIPELSGYDTVIIGGPVWGLSLSNPIRRFLQIADLTGKKVSAFWTFYDRDDNYDADSRKNAKGADYIKGLSLPRNLTGNKAKLEKTVDTWLDSLK